MRVWNKKKKMTSGALIGAMSMFPLVLVLLGAPCAAAKDLVNMQRGATAPAETPDFSNRLYVLPNGETITVERTLSDGSVVTDEGIRISPEGTIRDGEFQGGQIILIPDAEVRAAEGEREPGAIEVIQLPEDLPIEIIDEEKVETNEPQLSIADLLPKSGTGSEPKSPNKVKKGDKLEIPPGTYKSKDLSFLKGCWRAKALTYYEGFTPYKAPAELCFNGRSGGSFISHLDGVCTASTKVLVSGKTLQIKAGLGPCKGSRKNEATMPRIFQCEGEGKNSECYILAKDNANPKRQFKSKAVFYKE